jgi:hypothetical protein
VQIVRPFSPIREFEHWTVEGDFFFADFDIEILRSVMAASRRGVYQFEFYGS